MRKVEKYEKVVFFDCFLTILDFSQDLWIKNSWKFFVNEIGPRYVFREIFQNYIRWIFCKNHLLSSHNGKRIFANPSVISHRPPVQNFLNFECVPCDPGIQHWNFCAISWSICRKRAILLKMWLWKISCGCQTLSRKTP